MSVYSVQDRYWSRYFMCINICHPGSHPMRYAYHHPVAQVRKPRHRQVHNFPKLTRLVGGRAGRQP